MSSYLVINDKPYEGEFSSEPYDFGFELDSFQKHAITAKKLIYKSNIKFNIKFNIKKNINNKKI